MKRTLIKEIKSGTTVNLRGFVENIRNTKALLFVIIRDTTGKMQIFVSKESKPETAATFENLGTGSVVSITGKAVANPNVRMGGIEVIPDKIEVLSSAKLSPIDENSGPDLQMDYRWIDLRDTKKQALFTIQTVGERAMREYLIQNGFTEFHTSKITGFASEGGAEVFPIQYYGKKAYLTQSPQLYKQMAIAAGFEKFFEIGAYYRAEKSHTSRHASESFALDFEIAYIDSHHDLMDAAEEMLKYTLAEIEKTCGALIREIRGIDFRAQTAKFPRVTLSQAYELLEKERGYKIPHETNGDLNPDGERLLGEIAREKWNSDFIYVTDFPAETRAFYSMKDETDPKLTKSFDLLYKGLEIFSGAQREHNPEKLKQNMMQKGIDPKSMEFYTQFFEYGCPPHGGIGMGLARFFARLLDLPQIRDVVFLFRGPDRLAP